MRMAIFKIFLISVLLTAINLSFAQSSIAPKGEGLSSSEIANLREILKETPPLNSPQQQVDSFYKKQDAAAVRLGDMQERERVLKQWSSVSSDIDARWSYASFLMQTEKIQEGFELFENLIKDIKSADAGVRARARLAIGYIDQHNLKRAQELLNEADEIIKSKFNNSRNGKYAYWYVRAEMEYNNILGRLYLRQGKFEQALEASRLANLRGIELQKFESQTDERQIGFSRQAHAWVLTETAMIQIAMGKLFDADDSLRSAYALFKQYGLTENAMVDFYRRVAQLRFNEGRYSESIKILNMVLSSQKKQGLNPASAQVFYTQIGISSSLVAEKKWKDAVALFDEFDILTFGNPRLRNIARQTEVRALAYLLSGRIASAKQLMQGSLKWHIENFGTNHYYTSIVRGQYAMTLAAGNSNTDLVAARAEFEQAIKDMTTPNMLSTDYQESPYRQDVKRMILRAYLKLLANSSLQNQQDAQEAFIATNALIASSVQQAISEAAARAAIKDPKLAETARKDQDAKNELTTLYGYITLQGSEGNDKRNPEIVKSMRNRISELETLRKDIKVQIQKDFPEYFQLLQPKVPSPQDITRLLKEDELFISILPTDEETYIFAVAANGEVVFKKSSLNQLDIQSMVKKIRTTLDVAALGTNAPNFDTKTSFDLYQKLIQPLADLMKGKRHLIIAATGALGQIPFSVLPTQAPKANIETAWLVKEFSVSHIPSANSWVSLKRLEQTPSGQQALMAWGDPLFNPKLESSSNRSTSVRSVLTQRKEDNFDLGKNKPDVVRYSEVPPLPETRDEVLALAKTLNADPNSDVFLGKFATRDSVMSASKDGRLSKKKVVVFATHGLLAGDLPRLDQPALAMAASDQIGSSPLLTLEDVLSLKLNADWVVLSACNTAGADGRVEEAMSGLARGFFYAGSRSLLVTHWSVESESATKLTTLTFDAYQKNPKMPRAEALRSAMVSVMQEKRFSHPAFWAPYALVGEGGR
jgi:CHAT domain-containing protein